LGLKFSKKLNRGILDLLNKPKATRNCIFPLANLQKGLMIDFMPPSIIPEGTRLIADLNSQYTTFMLNNIEQE